MKKKILDLSYRSDNELEKGLSNLYPYKFDIDGYKMESWEGFIQSLKTPCLEEKKVLWSLSGINAWKYGQKFNNWKDTQKITWNNKVYERESKEYQDLIKYSYDCLFENEDFQKMLKKSLKYNIKHSIGNHDPKQTMLTEEEYISNLERLREKIKEKRYFNIFNLFS